MKIAIDGRVLAENAGKAVYTRSVLTALKEFPEHSYQVYGYQPSADEAWPTNWSFTPIRSRLDRVNCFRQLTSDVLFSPSSYLTTIVSNKPTLTTVHDLVLYRVAVKLPPKTVIAEKLLLPWALGKSVAITVQTKSVKDDLLSLFPAVSAKVHVVRPGVAPAIQRQILPEPAQQKTILGRFGISKKYFLFVGTLEPRKNLVRLVEAYQRLAPALQTDYQLILAGKLGWADRRLQATLGALPEGVRVTGRINDEALATLYHHAFAVVYPSLYEGVGYPILEGYYWNKPVVTSRTSSMAEVGEGATLLVEPTETESITAAMVQLATDPDLPGQLVEKGSLKLAQFSWPQAAQAYLEICRQIS